MAEKGDKNYGDYKTEEFVADPDDLPAKRMLDGLMKETATAEVERDEALEKLAAEPGHFENISAAIQAGWIIPNFFKQEHFDEMEGWNKDRLKQFQRYLDHESSRQEIEETLVGFIEKHHAE
jgi:hypothetical protein